MKIVLSIIGFITLLGSTGCVVEPAYPPAGVSVGVYGEYPAYYYGHGYYGYHRWHHPYDRDHYFYRYRRDWD